MTTPVATPLVWSAETLAPLGGFGFLALFFWLLWFIYSRAGSLYFLRDLIWRSFGGKTEFDDQSPLNAMRKELRDIEFFRYEFNIPATNLHEAALAHRWIIENGFSPSDIGRNRRYMDWADFNAPNFATHRFARKKFGWLFGFLIVLVCAIAPVPLASESKYLMVSLKDSPDTPSFYVSENDIKFEMWRPERFLTAEKCRTPEGRQPFNAYLADDTLDIVCSFFMDPGYTSHVEKGLKEQRSILGGFALICMVGMILAVLKLARMERASALYQQWQRRLAATSANPAGAPSPGGTAGA